MKNVLPIIFLLAIALVQVAVLPALLPQAYVPAVMLMAVVWAVFNTSVKRLLAVALLGGLAVDLYSGMAFGVEAISFALVGLALVYLVATFVPKENTALVLAGAATLGYLLHQFIAYALNAAFISLPGVYYFPLSRFFSWSTLAVALINLLLLGVVWLSGKRLRRNRA